MWITFYLRAMVFHANTLLIGEYLIIIKDISVALLSAVYPWQDPSFLENKVLIGLRCQTWEPLRQKSRELRKVRKKIHCAGIGVCVTEGSGLLSDHSLPEQMFGFASEF